jgi:2,3,4,5-tetrahydropyridine-2-carboxylate N-succinyltransferase
VTAVETNALAERIEAIASTPSGSPLPADAETIVNDLLNALERGEVRSAEKSADGTWTAVSWVKRGILLGFRVGRVVAMPDEGRGDEQDAPAAFFDKHTFPPRALTLRHGVRVVPGGTSIRRGAYVAPGVVCMPPAFVNAGAYIGAGTMVDSHALVGSCAQIGGVLEPVIAAPVVIESDAIIGGNCGVYEGTIVRARAVLGAGTVLTRGTPVFDLIRERVYRAEGGKPLEIPEGAVVVPGARSVRSSWAAGEGLSLQTPIIVKYRDEKTDLATALEQWLR